MKSKTMSASATYSGCQSSSKGKGEFCGAEKGVLPEAREIPDCSDGSSYTGGRPEAIRQKKLAEAIKKIDGASVTQTSTCPPNSAKPIPRLSAISPIPWLGSEPPFVISSEGGFFGLNEVHPTAIVHTVAIGGTGSGKTASCLLPLLKAQLRYALPDAEGAKRSSILVIDPKRELLNVVRSVLDSQNESDRLHRIGDGEDTPPVRFFDGQDELSSREKLDRLDKILETNDLNVDQHAYWHSCALQLLEQFLNLEVEYRRVRRESFIRCLWLRLAATAGNDIALRGSDVQELGYWAALHAVLNFTRSGRVRFVAVNNTLKEMLKESGLESHPDASVMRSFADEIDLMQWHYRLQSCDPLLKVLADPAVARVVDLEPFADSDQSRIRHSVNLLDAVDSGKVVVFQPQEDLNSALAARAIKARWYAAVRNRTDMKRPTGLVVDEFQRFITIDALSGDANFLDVARGYRCNCVLATQSVDALHNALGSSRHAAAAVASILANAPTKWFFATKDQSTTALMRVLIPGPPEAGPHIVDARPTASLKPGEAYWTMANASWGRGRAQLDLLN